MGPCGSRPNASRGPGASSSSFLLRLGWRGRRGLPPLCAGLQRGDPRGPGCSRCPSGSRTGARQMGRSAVPKPPRTPPCWWGQRPSVRPGAKREFHCEGPRRGVCAGCSMDSVQARAQRDTAPGPLGEGGSGARSPVMSGRPPASVTDVAVWFSLQFGTCSESERKTEEYDTQVGRQAAEHPEGGRGGRPVPGGGV